MKANFLLPVVFIVCVAVTICSCQIVRGSLCIGNDHCNGAQTNLICFEGRCRCPEALTMSSADLPSNLNTWWDSTRKKCFATRGAKCGTIPNWPRRVDCLPGNTCSTTGTCT